MVDARVTDGPGTQLVPVGERLGRWVIHFPAVVCTNSPSTLTSPVGVRCLSGVF